MINIMELTGIVVLGIFLENFSMGLIVYHRVVSLSKTQ